MEGKVSERYLQSGGLPDLLCTGITDSWSLSMQNTLSKETTKAFVFEMYEILTNINVSGKNMVKTANKNNSGQSESNGDEDNKLLEFYCLFTRFIPLSSVASLDSNQSLFYELVNTGIICFENKFNELTRIGFMHPSFIQVIEMNSKFIPLKSLYALKYKI